MRQVVKLFGFSYFDSIWRLNNWSGKGSRESSKEEGLHSKPCFLIVRENTKHNSKLELEEDRWYMFLPDILFSPWGFFSSAMVMRQSIPQRMLNGNGERERGGNTIILSTYLYQHTKSQYHTKRQGNQAIKGKKGASTSSEPRRGLGQTEFNNWFHISSRPHSIIP